MSCTGGVKLERDIRSRSSGNMNLSRWLSTVFQPQTPPTSSHLHLLNESKSLQYMSASNTVQLIGTRPVGVEDPDAPFQEAILKLGGKENILLVGEAGYSSENDGVSSGILQELSFALFQSPESHHLQRKDNESLKASNKALSCVTMKSPSKLRILEFPVILAVFRETLILDYANMTLIKEVLSDVEERTRRSGSKIVGIIYTRGPLEEQKNLESKKQLHNLLSQVFKEVSCGVCCYSGYQPKSILEVKRTIVETLEGTVRDQPEHTEDRTVIMERSFQDLVHQLGGKERFLLLGNVCPSVRPSEKAGIFKEISNALFDDLDIAREKHKSDTEEGTPNFMRVIKPTECTRLPQPKPFPYPLVLVAFRSSFLREEENRAQVKEILTDVKSRVTISSTQVIGVICSQEPLEEAEEQELRDRLQKILCQTFRCPTGVCRFVRNHLDSVEEVKRCVCHVLKLRN